jgi:KDO2-lipid IV(A) lauroyltransferase
MKKAVWLLEFLCIIIVSLPLAVLPLRWSLKAGELLGFLVFYVWGSRRRIAIKNLSQSVLSNAISIPAPAEQIIRENFRNLGKSFAEVIKIYFGLGKEVIDSVSVEGIEHFYRGKEKGKGILLLTGHCGNWELMAIATSAKGANISAVARPVNNPYTNRLVQRAREKFGNSVINKSGALKPVMQTLKKNGCVGILMDQAVTRQEGIVIDFLGRPAWTMKMPALIARKTGAAVLPVFIHRTEKGHVVKVYPEVALSEESDSEKAVKEDMVRFSGFIENYIREHPAEWLWIHRRWKRID